MFCDALESFEISAVGAEDEGLKEEPGANVGTESPGKVNRFDVHRVEGPKDFLP